MSRRENRRKKREEKQRDTEYVSLVDSYNDALTGVKECEKHVQEARQVKDRESEDNFRNELGILKETCKSLKDELGLDTPAELEFLYNSREIKVKGRARDWIVAKYHLNASGTLDKDAKITGIKIKEGRPWRYAPVERRPYRPPGPTEPKGMNIRITILREDGVCERYVPTVSHPPEAEKYLKTKYTSAKSRQNAETQYFNPSLAEYTDETYIRFWRLETGDALKRVGEFMEDPAYKNKIRITAKRIEG